MLLRRVIKHVRDQDWFAVALDFFIVVFGVFMGLQVQEWNEGRKEAIQERKYLERLHDEATEALQTIGVQYRFQQAVQTGLVGAIDTFRQGSDAQSLFGDRCTALGFSHVYDNAILQLPTVNELLTSGRLSVLKEDGLRALLSRHAQAIDGWEDTIDGMQADRAVLASKYPELIKMGIGFHDFVSFEQAFGEGDSPDRVTCDLTGMRRNVGFKNDLIDNMARHSSYFRFLTEQQEMLRAIHAELDAILSIDHQGQPE